MGSEQLLIGNVAIASVIIKTMISSAKLMFPSYLENVTVLRGLSLVFGILAAFAVNVELFEMASSSGWAVAAQKIIAGIFIGATAMGVHETTKSVTTS